jgi:hypothetical protein
MALANSSRNGARIIWVALHTAEGSRRRGDLYNFFDTVRSGSSHGGADGTGLDDGWVPDDRAAWTLLNGNPVSLNLEMCAFARWTREQWLSTGTVDGVVNPRQMIRNAAEWARRKCEKYGIPKTHIGVDGVAARRPGIIMHRDYTLGARDGDHTDIGNNFPWDVFFADMNGAAEEDDMSWDEVLTNQEGFKAPASAYLTYTNAAVNAQGAKLDELVDTLVGGGDTPAIQQHDNFIVDELTRRTNARFDDLAARVARLETSGVPVTVDHQALAAALADEQDRRARDNDHTTGPTT